MTIFTSLLSGTTAVFILVNLALLVAVVFWAMDGLSGQVREGKFPRALLRLEGTDSRRSLFTEGFDS